MMKTQINIFISFAYANHRLVRDFVERLTDYIMPSKKYDYKIWLSSKTNIGDDWDQKIHKQMTECDCAILLISPAFLKSDYIINTELPVLINKSIVLPVMLSQVDLIRHDLHGLEKMQIYSLDEISFKEPRAYSYLRNKWRDEFIVDIFEELENQLSEIIQ